MPKLSFLSSILFISFKMMNGEGAGIHAKQNVRASNFVLYTRNDNDIIDVNNEIGNGIQSNAKKNYHENSVRTSSLSPLSNISNAKNLPLRNYLQFSKLQSLLVPLIQTKFVVRQKATYNPSVPINRNTYDRRHYKNPYPINALPSFRLNRTKSDNKKRAIFDSLSHKGQIRLVNNSSVFRNTKYSLNNHSRFHEHKQQNQSKVEQRNMSTAKILNKRNVVDYDIIGEENEAQKEKQKHIWHAFNSNNSVINGIREHNVKTKHLEFISNSHLQSNHRLQKARRLSIEVYKVLSDAVVLDWYISLSDKDQMSTCDIAYFKSEYASNSEKAMKTEQQLLNSFIRQLFNQSIVSQVSSGVRNVKQSGVTFIRAYIPTTRTFLLGPLESNLAYVFQMACIDNDGYGYFSRPLYFKTAMSDKPSYREYHRFDLVNANNAETTNKQQMMPFNWYLKDRLTSDSRSYNGLHYQTNVAPAAAVPPVASISLPAISNSAVGAAVVARKNSIQQHDRISIRDKISPHLVLGVSCGIVGMIILLVTIGIAGRRYSQYRSCQLRIWEQQVVQDLASDATRTEPLNNHSNFSSINIPNNLPCQFRPFEASSDNMISSFPPPYTETCPISPPHSDEHYFCDQGLDDRILYELDSQYLHQLLPLNTTANSNNLSSSTNSESYISNKNM